LIISANLSDDAQIICSAKALTVQHKISHDMPQFDVNDFYEGYRVSVTSIGLQYFCSNKLYEESYNINHKPDPSLKKEGKHHQPINAAQQKTSIDKDRLQGQSL